jgi:predicted RNA binding protein YcfA (HicA-like mRNA interferase family)
MMRMMTSREMIRQLSDAGWRLQRVRGSHHVFVHSTRPGHIVVPHPKKELGLGLVRAIRKQAELEK